MNDTTTPLGENVDKVKPNLSRLQRLVYNLLLSGGYYSAADISERLHLSDPRGHIAKIRNKGYLVCDEWQTSIHGTRYKMYFVTNHL